MTFASCRLFNSGHFGKGIKGRALRGPGREVAAPLLLLVSAVAICQVFMSKEEEEDEAGDIL